MRSLRLGIVAGRAEWLRLRRLARRVGIRAGLAAVAVVFALLTLAFLHAAVVVELMTRMTTEHTMLVVAGGDLALALIFGWLALRRSYPGADEREARAVRDQALQPLCDLVSVGRLALRTERFWLRAARTVLRVLGRKGPD